MASWRLQMRKSSFRLILSPRIIILAKGIKLHKTEIWKFGLSRGSRCPKVASGWFKPNILDFSQGYHNTWNWIWYIWLLEVSRCPKVASDWFKPNFHGFTHEYQIKWNCNLIFLASQRLQIYKSSFRLILSLKFMILAKGIKLHWIEIWNLWLPRGIRCPKVALNSI